MKKLLKTAKLVSLASLTHLDAHFNNLGAEGKAALQEAVKDKPDFKLVL